MRLLRAALLLLVAVGVLHVPARADSPVPPAPPSAPPTPPSAPPTPPPAETTAPPAPAVPPSAPPPSTPPPSVRLEKMTPPGMQPQPPEPASLNIKVAIGGGAGLFFDPFHQMMAVRPMEQVSFTWAPGGIPGELGLSVNGDALHVTHFKLDIRYFLAKGTIFSHYLGIGLDLLPSATFVGGGGFVFGFEWALPKPFGIAWTIGADAIVYPTSAAPPLPIPEKFRSQAAFGYLIPSSLLALQARF